MSELPQGWQSARLGDLCEPSQYGYTAKAGASGNIHFLRTTDITSGPIDWDTVPFCDVDDETREKYLLRDGDVVISRAGSVGFSCLIRQPRPSVFASYLIRFRPRINSDYFKYFLLTPNYWDAIGEQSLGIAVQNVNASNLSEITVPIAPAAEQTRIVAKLEELLSDLDAGVAELKAAQKKLGQYRQSLLKAAVEGALTADWRKQQQAPLSPRGRGAGGEGENTPETDTWFRDRARELRKAQTPAENDLWQQLRAKRFSGFKFRRQEVIGNYIVDFVCFDQKLVIELDGSQHAETKERDESRDRWLSEQGFRVLRFWNNEWMAQAESVLETIWSALHEQPPLPNPSPTRGEGLNAPFSLDGLGGATETGAQLLARILTERRARWEAKQLAKFAEQGKTPPKDWQNKYPEPSSLNDTPRTTLPAGWTWASVDQLSPDDLANGRSVPSAERGAKVLRLTAVRNGRIDLSASKHGAWTEEEAKPFAVVEGDLLIVRGNGSLPLVGRAALVPKVHEQVAYPDTLIRLRVVESVVHPAWVSLMWDSETTRTHLERRARTSAGIYKISQPDIVSVAIPVPPLAEQDEILETFAASNQSIVELELMIGTSIKQSAAQRQNILRAAFSGQLVPQGPNDEPASVLLERIRAERAKNIQSKPRRQRAFAKPKV